MLSASGPGRMWAGVHRDRESVEYFSARSSWDRLPRQHTRAGPSGSLATRPPVLAGLLVAEVAAGGEDHRYVVFVAGCDYFVVAARTAGFDDGCDAGLRGFVDTVSEWEERV